MKTSAGQDIWHRALPFGVRERQQRMLSSAGISMEGHKKLAKEMAS